MKRRSDRRASTPGMVLPGAADAADPGEKSGLNAPVGTLDRYHRPLGEILVERELITPSQLTGALGVQAEARPDQRMRLGELLVSSGALAQEDLTSALGEQYGFDVIDMVRTSVDPSTVVRLPRDRAIELGALPIRGSVDGVIVAVADPAIPRLAEELAADIGDHVILRVSAPAPLEVAQEEAYTAAEGLGDIIRAYEARQNVIGAPDPAGTAIVDENAPIVQVVTRIIERAVHDRASDVHIEPMEGRVRVRNRIDGALKEVLSLPSSNLCLPRGHPHMVVGEQRRRCHPHQHLGQRQLRQHDELPGLITIR